MIIMSTIGPQPEHPGTDVLINNGNIKDATVWPNINATILTVIKDLSIWSASNTNTITSCQNIGKYRGKLWLSVSVIITMLINKETHKDKLKKCLTVSNEN